MAQSDNAPELSSAQLSSPIMNLPTEIMLELAAQLHNLEDLHYLSSTNKHIRDQLSLVTPNTILGLTLRSNSQCFKLGQNHQKFAYEPLPVIALVVDQLIGWAARSNKHMETLSSALATGFGSVALSTTGTIYQDFTQNLKSSGTVLDLCLKHCGLTMSTIRNLIPHHATAGVFFHELELMGELQDGLTSNRPTQNHAAALIYYQVIYGALFLPNLTAVLDPHAPESPGLGLESRLKFMTICVNSDADIQTLQATILWHRVMQGRGSLQSRNNWREVMFDNLHIFRGLETFGIMSNNSPEQTEDRMAEYRTQIDVLAEPAHISYEVSESIVLSLPMWPEIEMDAHAAKHIRIEAELHMTRQASRSLDQQ
ncbi:hypothetical protein BT63DRAFT_123274 [Microthyrium microscopicum]|uniref:F-box domain-containing protein n=1 Tax=Microthyrium microscopicum TaxID=703497 RepID=A0A6A6TVA1_9PEZI|nr:hypothetical protein BT63DRAFT_123274 [Microthyrium microscopicum]